MLCFGEEIACTDTSVLGGIFESAGAKFADLEENGAKMNSCGNQQNAFAACEETRPRFLAADHKAPTFFCPKPRRLIPLAVVAEPVPPFRWHSEDFPDSRAVEEDLVDLLLAKGGEHNRSDSSSPFFCGSPPSRASNPVVHDPRFGEDRPPAPAPAPFAPFPLTQSTAPMSPKHGCAHAKFGLLPAAVRVDGFDCLDRARRSCSGLTAVA
ncbi:hypothetical protein ZIOFF_017016 [Zingiber officinale]|uniref:Uncharacterized protein n=2 Tax=Zingiber officinale TaxID=94328 RepID=A0A8J5L9Z3_ZINOF|nr:hypothetical protein ZIOFF_017016 [Zingiber officinale]